MAWWIRPVPTSASMPLFHNWSGFSPEGPKGPSDGLVNIPGPPVKLRMWLGKIMIKYDKLVTVCRLWDACSWTIHSHTQQRSWSWALLRILFSTCLFQRKWKVKDLSSAVVSVTDSDPTTVRSTVLGPTQQHADPGPFTQNFILTKSTEPFIQADIWATRTAWPKSMRRRLAGRPLRVLRLVKGRGGRQIEFQCPMPNTFHL